MADVDFKPSELLLHPIPFVGTLRKAELESAACLIVRTLQATGDTWRVVTIGEVAKVLRADVAEGRQPLTHINSNPFLVPDVRGLAGPGWAVVTETTVELTPACLEALRPYVRRARELGDG